MIGERIFFVRRVIVRPIHDTTFNYVGKRPYFYKITVKYMHYPAINKLTRWLWTVTYFILVQSPNQLGGCYRIKFRSQ